ncbi:MAG: hypothetical protein ACYTG2_04580 [Planctomycetota bacterium]|jgi:hypothetical protein
MSSHWARQFGTLGLAVILLVVVAVLLPLLGAPAMLMQAGGWVAAAMLLFLIVQFVIFRAFNLRSRADERDPDGDERDDDEWRAWRG